MALKKNQPALRFSSFQVSADELDLIDTYQVTNPSVSATFFGTTAAGTATQVKPYVVISKTADYPRNAVYGVAGSAGMGGTFTVNGRDQFGNSLAETVTIGTAANGGTTAGTQIWAEISSGTFSFHSGAVGSGTPKVGVAFGTAAGLVGRFGLPVKIARVADVKAVTWINQGTVTVLNGGTVDSTIVGTTSSTFNGTAVGAITDQFVVRYKSTYVAEENVINSGY